MENLMPMDFYRLLPMEAVICSVRTFSKKMAWNIAILLPICTRKRAASKTIREKNLRIFHPVNRIMFIVFMKNWKLCRKFCRAED